MSREVLLLELGAEPLPELVPIVQVYGAWAPAVHEFPLVPVPGAFVVSGLVDGVLLSWNAVPRARYAIERAVDLAGAPGSWVEYTRIDDTSISVPIAGGTVYWWRVRAIVFGRASAYTAQLLQAPTDLTGTIEGLEDDIDQALGDAAAALEQLADIAADGKLDAGEKVSARQRYNALVDEQAGIDAQATAYAIAAPKTAYDAAITALKAYLRDTVGVLDAGYTWTGITGTTAIVRATWDGKWNDVKNARQALLNAILAASKANVDQVGEDLAAEVVRAQQAEVQVLADAAQAAAADATAKVNAAKAALEANIAVLNGQVADITGADAWDADTAYPVSDLVQDGGSPAHLYRAIQAVPAGTPLTNAAYWQFIGDYSSLGEAVAATAVIVATHTTELEAATTSLAAIVARMPAGEDQLANEARVVEAENAAATATGAVAQALGIVQARMPSGTDQLANEARVVTAEQAAATATGAVAQALDLVEARMPAGAGTLATEVQIATLTDATTAADEARGEQITNIKASLGGSGNLLQNTGFDRDLSGWTTTPASDFGVATRDLAGDAWRPAGIHTLGFTSGPATTAFAYSQQIVPIEQDKRHFFSVYAAAHRADAYCELIYLDAALAAIAGYSSGSSTGVYPGAGASTTAGSGLDDWDRIVASLPEAPANARYALCRMVGHGNGNANAYAWFARPMLEQAAAEQTEPSPYAPGGNEQSPAITANANSIDAVNVAIAQIDDFTQATADDLESLGLEVHNGSTGLAATRTDLTTLKGRVDTVGGGMEAIASNLDGVYAMVTSPTSGLPSKAEASVVVAMDARVSTVEQHGTGVNLLTNSSFAANMDGWGAGYNSTGFAPNIQQNDGDIGSGQAFLPYGTKGVLVSIGGTPANGTVCDVTLTAPMTVDALQEYMFSARYNACRCGAQVLILYLKADGTQAGGTPASGVGAAPQIVGSPTAMPQLSAFPKIYTPNDSAPSDAATATVIMRMACTGEANPYIWWIQPMLERTSATQAEPSPYNMGGAESFAMWSLEVSADGSTGSLVAMVDGERRDLVIDMDTVTFLGKNGQSSIIGGNFVQQAGGYMTVSGPGFGANSDLLDWFGPVMPVSACTIANSITARDIYGKPHTPAPPSVEPIEFNAFSGSTAAPNTLQLVNNDTAGAAKTVTARYYFQATWINPSDTPETGSATLSLWRKVGAGAFAQLGATQNVVFTDTVEPGPSSKWRHTLEGVCELVVTDNDASLSNHTYEWRLTARSGATVPTTQTMTIKTVE